MAEYYTTLGNCTPKLEAQLKSDREILHALHKEGLIGKDVYEDVTSSKCALSEVQKAGEVVKEIKDAVYVNPKKYGVLLQIFSQNPRVYGGIVEALNQEYYRISTSPLNGGSVPSMEAAPAPATTKPAVKKAPPQQPHYTEMIVQAIKESKSSLYQDIAKYIKANYNVGDNYEVNLKRQLTRMNRSGKLNQGATGSYKIIKSKLKPAAKKSTKPKAASKGKTTKNKSKTTKPKKTSAKKPSVKQGKPAAKKTSTGPKVSKSAAKTAAVKPAVKNKTVEKAAKKPAVKNKAAKKPAVKNKAAKKPAVKNKAVEKAAKKPAMKNKAVKKAAKKPATKRASKKPGPTITITYNK